ncbi:MAG: EamA family transporter [Desulfobulbaceae bacterium]|uniref:EamA family transporter n=1 Tax=Candidatus Desulfobia pelagia TaxID=2841692 RepID=A0A8J6NCM8_9BACT|nr:EamA family transporter [Candidatus Desulfobia pelagia]
MPDSLLLHWVPLGLLCAFSLASADALTKKFFGDYSGWQILVIRFVAPGILLLPLVFLNPLPAVPPVFWLLIFLLIPLELLAMWLYMLAIKDNPLHLTLPYLAFTPVFNILTAYIILGETVSFAGLGGIFLVVAGAFFLNIDTEKSLTWTSVLTPFSTIVRVRGSRLMLCVAMIYSVASVLGKMAVLHATPASFGPFYFAVLGIAALAITLLRKSGDVAILVKKWKEALMVGAFMGVMIITHFMAIARVEVAYFISLKRTSLLFGIVYGALLFKERSLRSHFMAGLLMLAGVALIVIK